MRASRLVSILLLLQTRGRMTARELADELEVSVRTIYRDVDSLSAAGVPLYGDAGPAGGYQLLAGYRTRLTGLTSDEAGSLALAGLPGPAAELGLGAVLAAAQLKVRAALPAELRDRADRIAERFHLDAPGWYRDQDEAPFLAEVAAAVWQNQKIQILYRRWRAPEQVTRTLDPYGLVVKAGRWYLVARGERRIATYRVSQILELEPLVEEFVRPADFDLAGYWRSYLDDFDARRYQGKAVVLLTEHGLERLPHLASRTVVESAEPTGDGRYRVVVPIETLDHATGELLRLGVDAEVLSPPELRDRLAKAVAELNGVYNG